MRVFLQWLSRCCGAARRLGALSSLLHGQMICMICMIYPHFLTTVDRWRQIYSRCCTCDLAHARGPQSLHYLQQVMLPRLDLYYADPAQPLTTAGEEPDDMQIMIYPMRPRHALMCHYFKGYS